jgi:para-nitrobenzyl esterase
MVWLHGGAYNSDSGNNPGYNLPGLPAHGVVLVTVNMRLGALGLLAHPLLNEESPHGVSGNYIFLDMIAALEWVRDNITAFGGDPGKVTIFGESGGGAKVASLMASPLAKGLFHKAIMESGTAIKGMLPGFSGVPLKDMEKRGQEIFAKLGVDKAADPLDAARALPWKDIIDVSMGLDATIDGWFLTDAAADIFTAGKQNPVPFITVANLGEITGPGTFLALFPALIPGYTNMLANAHKAGVKAYAAIFEYVPANWKAEGAVNTHAAEIPYVFGNMDLQSDVWKLLIAMAPSAGAKSSDPGLGETDRQLSEYIMRIWTQFARTGNPSVSGLVDWPAYDAAGDKYLALDVPLKVKTGFSKVGQEK